MFDLAGAIRVTSYIAAGKLPLEISQGGKHNPGA
jgi:hypothetical protein